MPISREYQRATDQFYELLVDARDASGLTSTHQACTMVRGVLQPFQRRLDVEEAIVFAGRAARHLRGGLGS